MNVAALFIIIISKNEFVSFNASLSRWRIKVCKKQNKSQTVVAELKCDFLIRISNKWECLVSKATKCSTSEGKGKERRRPCVTAALTWSLDWSFVSFMQQRNFCFCWFWWREMTEVKHSKLCLHGLNNWTYLMRLTVVCFSCHLVQRRQHQMETVLCFYLQMIQDRVQSSHSNRSFYRTVTQTSQHALCLRAETLRRLPYVMEASHSVSSSVSGFVQSLVPQWDLRVWHLVQRSEHHWTGTGNWDTSSNRFITSPLTKLSSWHVKEALRNYW